MNASTDQANRERIKRDLESTILVEAAAGAGKTTCIVDRMVNLVASGECDIGRLAAMTFTRKAAAEMRERFYDALRRRTESDSDPETKARSLDALERVEHAFIGTIHAFCAVLIRERPVEFGVDPGFRELDDAEDSELVQEAWRDFLNRMHDEDDDRLDRIAEYGLQPDQLQSCFQTYIDFPDVDAWPDVEGPDFDVAAMTSQVKDYIADIRQLQSGFPVDRKTDKLMDRYDEIVRKSDHIVWDRIGEVMDLVELFDRKDSGCVLSHWDHGKEIAKAEKVRWASFRESLVLPALDWWRAHRYAFLIRLLGDAAAVYDQLRRAAGGLSFQDLLLHTANGLQGQSELRRYFQRRFTHLLVDEFQDTDPIQARILAFLASEDGEHTSWSECRLRPGALFLVGDPKQSIYRFRRADISTYRKMKQVVESSGGAVVPLVRSFRSVAAVREWNNDVFTQLIGAVESDYSPAAAPMEQGREDCADGVLQGVWQLTLSAELNQQQTTREESEQIAEFIANAIQTKATIPRSQSERDQGRPDYVEPSDFLIIAWRKEDLAHYAGALNRRSIPTDVSGASAFDNLEELQVLRTCLQVVDDPTNPIPYTALLRSSAFGFDDGQLFQYRQAGGRFNYYSTPDELNGPLRARFEAVNDKLNTFLRLLRQLPFAVAAEKIATELGLQARCAAAESGNIALGGFLKAIEWLRAESWRFDSARDMIAFIDQLTDGEEAEPCSAQPHPPSAVKVMNLHKAKGLEASVVFLANVFGNRDRDPTHHVRRSGNRTLGYLSISKPRGQYRNAGVRPIAQPADWDEVAVDESRFQSAEEARLLYVAATRAKTMLVISQRDGKKYSNHWRVFEPFLTEAQELSSFEMGDAVLESTTTATTLEAAPVTTDREEIENRWAQSREPSYELVAAKAESLKGVKRPTWQSSGDYGPRWGSAVHDLLEFVGLQPDSDLRVRIDEVIRQYDLGSDRADELLETVNAVTNSEVWQRSLKANQRFVELPIDTLRTDSAGENVAGSRPAILRGVIDLIFEEDDGWVIVDYKTDDLSASEVAAAVHYYGGQVRRYEDAWRQATNLPVKECGLYFTRLDRYELAGAPRSGGASDPDAEPSGADAADPDAATKSEDPAATHPEAADPAKARQKKFDW